ncbi:MAG: hypothetical protein JW990_04315, partial [Thermoleophilia bacterium]|nr:hypothetical protein [Thermoleophilia bacterium]
MRKRGASQATPDLQTSPSSSGRRRVVYAALLVIAMAAMALTSTAPAFAGTIASLTTGDNSERDVLINWIGSSEYAQPCQTFGVSQQYRVTRLGVKLSRDATDSSVYGVNVGIHDYSASLPGGYNLTYGCGIARSQITIDPQGAWYYFDFTDPVLLEPGHSLAVAVNSFEGGVRWRYNAEDDLFGGGQAMVRSPTLSSWWPMGHAADFMFEIIGTDLTPPLVSSVNRAGANPTDAANVSYTVTFSEPVNGVDASDFALFTTGAVAGASITSVSGSGSSYTVVVNRGTGNGTVRLDVLDDDSIVDVADANPLYGTGAGSGYTSGQVYEVWDSFAAPIITQHPAAASITYGESATLTMTAIGWPVPAVQWQWADSSGGPWTDVSGAVDSSLTVTTPSASISGRWYRAKCTNSEGTTYSSPAQLTVAKGSLTVTADNKVMTAGAAEPSYTVRYGGFVLGEDEGGLTTAPTATCGVAHSAPGTYPIVVSGGADEDYSFVYVEGTLTVMAVATVTATGWTGPYDGAIHLPTVVTNPAGLDLRFTSSPPNVFPIDVGTYVHTFTVDDPLYTGTATATIQIDQADATVIVEGWTGPYDGSPHGAVGTATGVRGQNLSGSLSLGGTFTDPPGGTVYWSFEGGTNYLDENGSVEIVIAAIPPEAMDD